MKKNIIFIMMTYLLSACNNSESLKSSESEKFTYSVDKFADVEILRYQVPGFDELSLEQKKLIYFLSQAATEGRDILYDQNNKYNLTIRKTLETIYNNYEGDKQSDDYANLVEYLKRVWFSNGIHHHYATDKFEPKFTKEYFTETVKSINPELFPISQYNNNIDSLLNTIVPVMFDKTVFSKRVNPAHGVDLITTSANNYYENVTDNEVDDYYNNLKNPDDVTPLSYGLNSKLIIENGEIFDKCWRIGEMYSPAMYKIVLWLKKAEHVA